MSDTQRTIQALQAILADNTTGDISPQDVRDFLVSVSPSRGGYTLDPGETPGETVIAETGQWVKIAGDTLENDGIAMRFWSKSGENELRYTGQETQAINVFGMVSLAPGEGNTEYSVTVAHNDTPFERFAASQAFAGPQSGNALETVAVMAALVVEPEDTVSLWIRRDAGDGNPTVTAMSLTVTGFIR